MKTWKQRKTAKAMPAAAPGVPSKWQWHYRRLQSLRDALVAECENQASEVREPIEPHGMDDADGATDEFEHDLALGILSHEEDTLFEVDSAIRRIMDGTYGVCEKTGNPIPEARLKVVPWTRFTREALEEIECHTGGGRPYLSELSSLQGPAPGGLAKASEPEDLMSAGENRRRKVIRGFGEEPGLTINHKPPSEP